ncbi:hypothetical protein DFH27DRAFT_556259 [Peziza echinospora]|nr:hypothetical protein DFH27DRAFT_556259 [Peziza echinospora]
MSLSAFPPIPTPLTTDYLVFPIAIFLYQGRRNFLPNMQKFTQVLISYQWQHIFPSPKRPRKPPSPLEIRRSRCARSHRYLRYPRSIPTIITTFPLLPLLLLLLLRLLRRNPSLQRQLHAPHGRNPRLQIPTLERRLGPLHGPGIRAERRRPPTPGNLRALEIVPEVFIA